MGLFTLVSLLGIAASVMLFLVIDSIINGLSTHLRSTLLGFEAPLFLEVNNDEKEGLEDKINKFKISHPEYKLKSLFTKQFDGLIQVPGQSAMGIRVRSVDEGFFDIKKDELDIYWFEGFSEEDFTKNSQLILIGETIFEHLKFMPGDDEIVVVTHPFADIGPTGDIEPADKVFFVAGLFSTGRVDFDERYTLISNKGMSALASDSMLKKQFYLFPARLGQVNDIKQVWNTEFSEQTTLMTWYDKNQNLFRAMSLEKLMYFIIFIFVLVISCFNLAALITIFGVSKSEDTAVLRTLGLKPGQIKQIFVNIGFLLGGMGTVLGLIVAMILILLAKGSGFSLPEAYGFTELPLAISLKTFFILFIGTPLFTALIAYIPATRLTVRNVREVLMKS